MKDAIYSKKNHRRGLYMNSINVFTIIGVVATLIGLAIAILSFIFLKKNKISSIITGVFLSLIGFSIFWISLNPDKVFEINLGISDKSARFLIIFIMLGMFMLRFVMLFQEGSKELKDKKRSTFSYYQSKWKIFGAIVGLSFYIYIAFILFSWWLR
jgi:hypothetical protein